MPKSPGGGNRKPGATREAGDPIGGVTSLVRTRFPGHDYQFLRAESPLRPLGSRRRGRAGQGARLEFTAPNPGPEPRWYYRFGVNP